MSISEISITDLSLINNPVLIDVREVDEYVTGHVPGAINIPLSELVGRETECGLGKTVYVICQAGGRSLRACGHLSTIPALDGVAFINVAGGTGMWIVEGHEVTTGDTAS
ncbi:MAG: rhodanese-like domain-containing protein [Actinomycetota bacterium]